ncbi:hypothetical protein MNBD_NITROSPINAE01-202 [hydrothermal vent metagenome]|uniref:TIGR02300 family protein n=1 Tax=hydrothermal vent metagenome TaxID=652676 RepID=A0A3B1BML4_9ZZZZ
MPHPKFGNRYTCFQCGAKFYDMKKEKPICPKCEANQLKAPKKSSVTKAPKRQPVVEEFDTEDTPSTTDDHEEKEVDISENLSDFPVAGTGESFENNVSNPLAVDDLPDEEGF